MEARLSELDPKPIDVEAKRLDTRAFLAVSFLSLFLEILLIRWCGAEIRILAYVKNLTLLACFLGLGIGYAAARRRPIGIRWTFAAVAALIALAHPALAKVHVWSFRDLSRLLNFDDMNAWLPGSGHVLELIVGTGLLCVLFSLLAVAFVPLGQTLGSHFRAIAAEERVRHYTLNVAASLAGVIAFGVLGWAEAPPIVWFVVAAVAAVAAVPLTWREAGTVVLATAATLGLLVESDRADPILEGDVTFAKPREMRAVETRWSPYQKIQLVEEKYTFDRPRSGSFLVDGAFGASGPPHLEWTDWSAYVNGHWYSRVGTVDLDVAQTRAAYAQDLNFYENQALLRLPYHLATGRKAVLLLGAGMGRDAATALDEKVERIDCVEIERRFVEWGRAHNPQHAYDENQERVHVHVDDARRFLRASDPSVYDLVVFCYLDAHSLTSNFTNTNLDSYVYTAESIAEAKRTLAPGGVLALGFWSPRPFIYARIEGLLEGAFGAPPLRLADGSLFVTGLDMASLRARAWKDPTIKQNLKVLESSRGGGKIEPTTDDWPFFYVERPTVPWVYRAVLLAMLIISAAGVRGAVGKIERIDPHFLFLGAAFMLVETWSISRASLVYGATWYVSSAVIASLLVAVLAANYFVEKRGLVALSHAFPLLICALAAATLLDPSQFLSLPRALQLALAAPVYAVPFLFASAIFASSLARAERVDEALASNLLGSVIGGALECLSFATGLRSLGFVAIGLYAAAWVSGVGLKRARA